MSPGVHQDWLKMSEENFYLFGYPVIPWIDLKFTVAFQIFQRFHKD